MNTVADTPSIATTASCLDLADRSSATRFVGRASELKALRDAVDASVDGMRSVLVIEGEPGVGKSALLEAFTSGVPEEVLVLEVGGVESESDIGYAGLHRLISGLLPFSAGLPAPQASALHTALGLASGPTPDRFHVGLAALTLLTDAAAELPILCVVDDAQWLDPESLATIAFVARRAHADRITMVFATRGEPELPALGGFSRLTLAGLSRRDGIALLAATSTRPFESDIAAQVVDELGGNPLAVIELAQAHGIDEIARQSAGPGPLLVGDAVERLYGGRLSGLPGDTRTLLLILAADQRIDLQTLERAAGHLGIEATSLEVAEAAGLVDVGDDGPVFRHPLVRSVCYRSAPSSIRRRIHAAIGAALDPDVDIERLAWHRALAADGPDDDTASLLAKASRRAGERGVTRSQIELLCRAAELSTDPEKRSQRYLWATSVSCLAADGDRFAQLCQRARSAAVGDPVVLAGIGHMEALAPVFERRYSTSPRLLIEAAGAIDQFDRSAARSVLLEALFMLECAGPAALGATAKDIAQCILAMPRRSTAPETVIDLLVDGYAKVILSGWPAGATEMKAVFRRWSHEADTAVSIVRHLGPPIWAAFALWDEDALDVILRHDEVVSRDSGALNPLRSTLVYRSRAEVASGGFAEAEALAQEINDLTVMLFGDESWRPNGRVEVEAWRGDAEALALSTAELRHQSRSQELGSADRMAGLAAAIFANGRRQYAAAAAAARPVAMDRISAFGSQALLELAEALAMLGDLNGLAPVLDEIDGRANASGTRLALGVSARTRAFASEGAEADELFRVAIGHLEQTRSVTQLARARLSYGEWLRREKRTTEARVQLRSAHEQCLALGAAGFAERASAELEATGEKARRQAPAAGLDLTPQERQVVMLVQGGLTNKEIASQLYLSANTVDYHLRKVFRKLNISSRRELLPGRTAGGQTFVSNSP